jgi:sugar/nucleoside kinase (ribokinase family)
MSKVIGMGNALVDVMTILKGDRTLKEFALPKGSMQLVSKEFSNRLLAGTLGLQKIQSSGGSAANTIHGLANLGIETGFVGKIGKDNLGRFFENDLMENHITPILFHDLEETGRSIALISKDSERTMATYLGAAVDLHEEDISSDLFADYLFFHVEGYLVQNRELMRKALRLARSHGLTVSLDMASFNVVADNRFF